MDSSFYDADPKDLLVCPHFEGSGEAWDDWATIYSPNNKGGSHSSSNEAFNEAKSIFENSTFTNWESLKIFKEAMKSTQVIGYSLMSGSSLRNPVIYEFYGSITRQVSGFSLQIRINMEPNEAYNDPATENNQEKPKKLSLDLLKSSLKPGGPVFMIDSQTKCLSLLGLVQSFANSSSDLFVFCSIATGPFKNSLVSEPDPSLLFYYTKARERRDFYSLREETVTQKSFKANGFVTLTNHDSFYGFLEFFSNKEGCEIGIKFLFGFYFYADGSYFLGNFSQNGVTPQDKEAKIEFQNGDEYNGEVNSGQKSEGVYVFAGNQMTYEGAYDHQGKRTGQGLVSFIPNKEKKSQMTSLEVFFRNGHATGEAVITYSNFDKYKGRVLKSLPSGKGVYESSAFLYKGDFASELPHGKGKLETSLEGFWYEGEFVNGVKKGKGRSYWPDKCGIHQGVYSDGLANGPGVFDGLGVHYEGSFLKGEFDGEGVWEKEKSKYVGMFKNGKKEGFGEYFEENELIYSGEWALDKKHGKGRLFLSNGDIYSGEFLDDQRGGFGELQFKNGDLYKGEFNKGKIEGHGTLKYKEGMEYTGNFLSGERHGQGKMTNVDGIGYYQGEWSHGIKEGLGEEKLGGKEGKYKGNFKEGFYNGEGTFYYPDQWKYKGNWLRGKRHGKGSYFKKLKKPEGQRVYEEKYEGDWANDKYEGIGELLKPNGDRYVGTFEKGKIKGEGRYFFKNGIEFNGKVYNDMESGDGKFLMTHNQRVYVGSFSKQMDEGNGKLDDLVDAIRFQIKWSKVRGKEPGIYYLQFICTEKFPSEEAEIYSIGKMSMKNFDAYEGEMKNGIFNGEGEYIVKNPMEEVKDIHQRDKRIYYGLERYKGHWVNGIKVTPLHPLFN